MELRRYREVEQFYARAERFLLEHEAEHNLILGITTGLIQDSTHAEHQPYLAAVQDAGRVVAAAIRTPPHKLLVSIAALDSLALIVSDAHRLYQTLPGLLGPRDASRAFAEAWQQISRQPYRPGVAQRIYQLEAVTPVSGVPGEFRLATQADWELLVVWSVEFDAETFGEGNRQRSEREVDALLGSNTRGMYLWQHGQPVSMAAYSGPTQNGIRVGRVYTPPQYRGKGYASACVAALSQYLLDSGRRSCFLYTDLSNPVSNRIYQRIGYRPVVDVDEYVFMEAPL